MPRLLLPPAPELAGIVRYFHLQWDGGGAMQVPATPFMHLGILLEGAGQMAFHGQPATDTPRSFVSGALSRPCAIRATPGSRFISALLRIGQAQRLFPPTCDAFTDQVWPLQELVGHAEEEKLHDSLQRCATPQEQVRAMSGWLKRLAAKREDQRGSILLLPPRQLFDDGKDLAKRSGLGVRQFERRFLASYGLTLRDTRRMFRFINMMGILIARPDARGQLGWLAQECGYFDQAHMARDFKALSGMTPGDFLRDVHDPSRPEMSLMRYSQTEQSLVLGAQSSEVLLLSNPRAGPADSMSDQSRPHPLRHAAPAP
ncbi:helix-turn-helix domain-containing protein [Chromobacterium sp. IIBBL 290-4]|uniref:AraC family transcriptional regulator n=1 Tax=Chromobacterium sp. IIBBL 290-4 TaxID=2953890 RepID=UPI0020B74939|nr:helix-turn-helix domain-containing protein [Chromobacterium sp. IIBBL 290-4]UTH73892.1 helix-turn-helix domain-containing protein [Chromobacterium sp. IIBBL 290-4]